MSKRNKSSKILLIFIMLVIFSLLSLFVTKFIYDKFREPDFYAPNQEPGEKALLPGATWVPQTFNNCAPATTSMILQYFGYSVGQEETKARLRTNPDDKNVFTYEMAEYLREDYGIESKLLYGGDIQILKKLITNGFYVVVEDWLHPNEDIGHVTIIRGFDDAQGVLIADDSFIGVNITYPYEEFIQTQWKAFNYEYLPLYLPENEDLLASIIGSDWDEETMYKKTAQKSRDEIAKDENDLYAWFNLGTSLFALSDYNGAKEAFEKSQSIGWPKRMLWYQIQPIQNYNKLGEFEKAIELANIALLGNDSFAEAHLEKATAYEGLGELQKATEEREKAKIFAP